MDSDPHKPQQHVCINSIATSTLISATLPRAVLTRRAADLLTVLQWELLFYMGHRVQQKEEASPDTSNAHHLLSFPNTSQRLQAASISQHNHSSKSSEETAQDSSDVKQ